MQLAGIHMQSSCRLKQSSGSPVHPARRHMQSSFGPMKSAGRPVQSAGRHMISAGR